MATQAANAEEARLAAVRSHSAPEVVCRHHRGAAGPQYSAAAAECDNIGRYK